MTHPVPYRRSMGPDRARWADGRVQAAAARANPLRMPACEAPGQASARDRAQCLSGNNIL